MKRFTQFPEDAYLRTCQECHHVQIAKDPATYKSDSWRDVKCKNCRSESLDYGTSNYVNEDYIIKDGE